MNGDDLPDPVIMSYALDAYAAVRGELSFVRQRRIFLFREASELLGPVPAVALYADPAGQGAAIAYCDDAWGVIAFDDSFRSLGAARAHAEAEYPGISARWTRSPYSQADLEAAWSAHACSFCRRRKYEFDACVAFENGSVICNDCLALAPAHQAPRARHGCSFCGRASDEFDDFRESDAGVVICARCLADARPLEGTRVCSFCGRGSDEFDTCLENERVVLCNRCLTEAESLEAAPAQGACSFCGHRDGVPHAGVGSGTGVALCDTCRVHARYVLEHG